MILEQNQTHAPEQAMFDKSLDLWLSSHITEAVPSMKNIPSNFILRFVVSVQIRHFQTVNSSKIWFNAIASPTQSPPSVSAVSLCPKASCSINSLYSYHFMEK